MDRRIRRALGAIALPGAVMAIALPAVAAGANGTPSAAAKKTLVDLRVEEKVAHDVYVALYEKWGLRPFANIARSETQHGTRLEALLSRYGVADPTDGLAEGSFPTAASQRLYDSLVAKGLTSASAAYAVGRQVERMDIADLTRAKARTSVTALDATYSSLIRASRNHLRAFGG